MRPTILGVTLASLLAGCVIPSSIDQDIEQARLTADGRGALDPRPYESLANSSFLGGNAVELLKNGPATYAAMTKMIEAARRRIDMESYTFEGDEAVKFGDLLLAKRAQGLEVNLIYDAWGSNDTKAALFKRLKQGGIKVLEYNPVSPTDALDLNSRDHRKLLVADAEIVIMGGINISPVYDNRRVQGARTDDSSEMPWRDTDVRIEGPAAAQFERMFMSTWHEKNGAAIPDPPPTPATPYGATLVMAIGGKPANDHPHIYQTLLLAIALARSSIHLTTGFFAPTPELDRALKRAARRGVEIDIIVSSKSTSTAVVEAGRADYASLMAAGVHVHERRDDVVIHAKTAVIDGAWSTVGSSNLDWRSVAYNEESDALVLSAEFGRQMEAMFSQDLGTSREIDPQTWADRPLRERIEEWGASLIEFLL
jgi:cardiolipin synthase